MVMTKLHLDLPGEITWPLKAAPEEPAEVA